MKNTNIYKLALITGAMAATGFAFATYTGGLTPSAPVTSSTPQTVMGQKDTSKETSNSIAEQNKPQVSIDEKDGTGSSSDENGKETKDDAIKLPVGAISEDTAKKTVLSANPQAQIIGVETENENGVMDYNISLKDGTDVKVDVIKGTILKTDKRGNEEKVNLVKGTKDDSSEGTKDSDSQNED